VINENKQELPPDAVMVKQIGPLAFYLSKEQDAFFITTEDYHSGPVKFSKTEMLELLSIFQQQTGEKEKELLAELEQEDDEDF
jgi:hypothetical protein